MFMSIALNLAYRGLGNVAPNPAVGCVIVKNNHILSRGWTQPGGRPHAEYVAITNSKDDVRGATMYVSLEPCVHHGQTAPCVDLIISSGIKKVFVAVRDSDVRVSGRGIEKLREAGVVVEYGLCEKEARELNIGYFYSKERCRPYITLKLATTADAKIATKTGESKWITNELARKFAHKLRAQNDAIMIGTGTLIKDNPRLTCRLPGLEGDSPIKIVVDSKGKLKDSHLLLGGKEVLTFTNDQKNNQLAKYIGGHILSDGCVDLLSGVKSIAEYGITRLLIEGGGKLASSLLKDNIVDQIIWIKSNTIAGSDAISAIHDLSLSHVSKFYKLKISKRKKIYDNIVDFFDVISNNVED